MVRQERNSMRCFFCSFHDYDELESRLVDFWIWLERTESETPQISIRQDDDGSAGEILLIWPKDDGRRENLPPMWRHAPLHRAPIFKRYNRCDAAANRSPFALRAMPRATASGDDAPDGQLRRQRSNRDRAGARLGNVPRRMSLPDGGSHNLHTRSVHREAVRMARFLRLKHGRDH
jgi:hypothetical protein